QARAPRRRADRRFGPFQLWAGAECPGGDRRRRGPRARKASEARGSAARGRRAGRHSGQVGPMPAGRLRAALSRVSLTRALVGLGVVIVSINVCVAIWDIRADRARTEQRAQRDFSNLTRLLAEQTAASLDAVDVVLRDAVRDGSAAKAAAMLSRMPEELAHIAQLAAIVVLDRKGEVLTQTNPLPSIDPDLSKLAFFSAHRDGHGPALILSEPFLGGPVATSWRFVVSRRFTGFGGAFDGVLAAIMEIDRFERLYQTIDVGEGGFIALLSLDGVMITRVPDPLNVKGKKFQNHEVYDAVKSG